MKNVRSTLVSVSILSAGLAMSSGVFATSTWTPTAGCTNSVSTAAYGNTWSCTGSTTAAGDATTVTASAWSAAIAVSGSTRSLTGSTFASGYLSNQGTNGFGAANQTESLTSGTAPEHTIDSYDNNRTDLVFLNFGAKVVTLDSIGVGFISGDSDISLLRWTGASAPTVSVTTTSKTLSSVLSSVGGWELVGSYAGLVSTSTPISTGLSGSGKSSSWWLISAFDTAYGISAKCSSTTTVAAGNSATICDAGDDGFKLNYIVASTVAPPTTGKVPEPGSLALAGIALAGVFGVRRRAVKQA